MHRFFVPPASLNASRVRIEGEVAQQIRRVLRMRPGDQFCLLDGLGYEYRVALIAFDKDEAWVDVLDKVKIQTEPANEVSIYLSLLNKPDKFEWVLQKCTELGAARFAPLVAERSVTGAVKGMRRERWERIIKEAAEQSGRGLIPALDEPVILQQALEGKPHTFLEGTTQQGHISIMPELDGTETIAGALRNNEQTQTVSIYIGPEGGFTPAEVNMAREVGVKVVSLGPRTLRSETAAVAALTVTLHELGEMGTAKRDA